MHLIGPIPCPDLHIFSDRLIASLQEDSGSSSSSPAALLELEDVKNERDLLREEVSSLLMQLESARMELAEAEAQVRIDKCRKVTE